MEQNGKEGPKRERLLVHNEEWFRKVLSENIAIAIFIDELLYVMEELDEDEDGKYDLAELDAHMEKMPEIEYESAIKEMLMKGVEELHEHGVESFDDFYADLKHLLDDLGDAETLFTNETMERCGETDEDMFHKK